MADYHRYIYDTTDRKIIGDFEGAYRHCDDVWPSQHDTNQFKYRIAAHLMRDIGPHARLADIGSGYGDFIASLRGQGLDAMGYEISPTAVERGRARFGHGAHLQVANLKDGLPAGDGSYDVVTLFGVLWYLLDHLDASFGEIQRILKPGGHVLVSLSMVLNPIGGDVIGSHDDVMDLLRRHFDLGETLVSYLREDVAAGKPLAGCGTDLVVHGRKR